MARSATTATRYGTHAVLRGACAFLLFLGSSPNAGAFQVSTRHASAPTIVASSTRLYQARMPAILGRFRKKREVEQVRTISEGDPLPDIDVEVIRYSDAEGSDGDATTTATPMSIRQVLGESGSAVLVGMPGAFTPTCSNEHLPGYVASIPKFRALGIDKIAVMTTNDRHVNEEWGSRYGLVPTAGDTSQPVLTIVSDGDGDLAKAMGLADDMGFGVGVRSKRFAMVVTDGIVSTLLTDEGMDDCSCTSAQSLLRVLTPDSAVGDADDGEGNMGLALAAGGAAVVLGLLLTLGGGGGGGGSSAVSTTPKATPTPKVQAQPGVKQPTSSSKGGFNLLNDYL